MHTAILSSDDHLHLTEKGYSGGNTTDHDRLLVSTYGLDTIDFHAIVQTAMRSTLL